MWLEGAGIDTGAYCLTVESDGFRAHRVEDLELVAGRGIVCNIRIELGAGAEEVTVAVSYDESERVGNISKVGCFLGLWGKSRSVSTASPWERWMCGVVLGSGRLA